MQRICILAVVENESHASLADAWKHERLAGEVNVRVQVLADAVLARHDGLEGDIVDCAGLPSTMRGWKSPSVHRKRPAPNVMMSPSKIPYVFSWS